MRLVTIPKDTLLFFARSEEESDDHERLFPTLEDLVRRFAARRHGDFDLGLNEYWAGSLAEPLLLADLTSHRSAADHGFEFRRLNDRDAVESWFEDAEDRLLIDGQQVAVDGFIVRSNGLASSWTQFTVMNRVFDTDDEVRGGILRYSIDSPAVRSISDSLVRSVKIS